MMNLYRYAKSPARRYVAHVSTLGTTQLHLRNPWVIASWSAMFPGSGHLLLSKYLRGYILFILEVVINVNSHINLAIFYSFTGRFEMAKDILDINWMMLYIPTYLFSIWDSYRTTVDLNHNFILAAREDAKIQPFKINALEINYLDKRSPWLSAVWSLLMPGTGQLYIHRIVATLFIIAWWIVIIYISKLLPAIHYTLLGEFELTKSVVDKQWLLNIPSVYFFAAYDAYVNTVENNKLYDWEQAKFLSRNYQNNQFNMPFKEQSNRGDMMYIVSIFEHSKYLEMAITAIQMKGVAKGSILAVPMDKRAEERTLFDSLHYSDGLSMLDLPVILAALLALFGGIYGFIFKWGPLIWGLIGMVTGLALGLVINLVAKGKYNNRQKKVKASEVVLIIECKDNQLEMVKNTLWEHYALGVRKLDLGRSE